ncbi:MAG: GTP-binding protein, partial [Methylococcales bacterium]
MDYAYSDLIEKAKSWSQQGVETGWLSQSYADALNQLDERTPASLFDQDSQRPLVVAFFGGTGVGKSTLLNR